MYKRIVVLFGVLIFISTTASCTSIWPFDKSSEISVSQNKTQSDYSAKQSSKYYDFEDILIPQELKLKSEESIIFESPNIKAGVVAFEANIEPISLFNFFMNNMPKDNWQLRSYFKYNRYLLVFEKPHKFCVLRIQEKRFTTNLQVWVTPRIASTEQSKPMMKEEFLNQ